MTRRLLWGIQIRGIFNELQLRDLRKKTLRGQIGQKQRGFSVGERTYGYRSVPVGEMRIDKRGQPRPDGYRMEINPAEAAVVLRIFQQYSEGASLPGIVRSLNDDRVPGRVRATQGWSPATVSRILDNEKYVGRWVWNKTENRRDPRSGRKRQFDKPESEWILQENDELRIVPSDLWQKVREHREQARRAWPGAPARRGFSSQQGSRQKTYPTHLLSGAMTCGSCGAAMAQVSGKSGGYYGCLAATKGACANHLLVRRTLAERVIIDAVRGRLTEASAIRYVLEGVESEVKRMYSDVPETIRLKESELQADERRLANFVDFIGEGRGSRALASALTETERRVESLREEVDGLRRSRDAVFQAPPIEWIEERLSKLRPLLEQATERSAQLLRQILGTIRLEPTRGDIGRPYYLARTSIDTLALLDPMPGSGSSESGSNSLRWWGCCKVLIRGLAYFGGDAVRGQSGEACTRCYRYSVHSPTSSQLRSRCRPGRSRTRW